MRNPVIVALLLSLCSLCAVAQQPRTAIDGLYQAQEAFGRQSQSDGEKAAFLKYLAGDAIVFRPLPVSGISYWKERDESVPVKVDRTVASMDVSSDGRLGYTTGMWHSSRKDGAGAVEHYGEYVTIWERRDGQDFKAVLDITTKHDDIQSSFNGNPLSISDPNSKGWSATNDVMKYLRTGMAFGQGLAAALKEMSMDDVRLLIDDQPPIIGKEKVVEAAKQYTGVGFPADLAIYQFGDMAYFWNQCRYQNSVEGLERGNCLQVMKLRNKKWWIVLAAFARLDDDKPPVLAASSRRKTQ